MRKIVLYPAKILRQKTKEIEKVDKKLLAEVEELKELLVKGENAAGLAAVQIGFDRRFFGSKELKVGAYGNTPVQIFINPKIEKSYGVARWGGYTYSYRRSWE